MYPLFGLAISPGAIILLLLAGVVLFGRRLPEIGRYLGKGLTEFKKGMRGVEDDLDVNAAHTPPAEAPRPPQRIAPAAPKFEEQPLDAEGKPRA